MSCHACALNKSSADTALSTNDSGDLPQSSRWETGHPSRMRNLARLYLSNMSAKDRKVTLIGVISHDTVVLSARMHIINDFKSPLRDAIAAQMQQMCLLI